MLFLGYARKFEPLGCLSLFCDGCPRDADLMAFMDKKNPGKEVCDEDLTRESLIAISYLAPEKEPASGYKPEDLTGDPIAKTKKAEGDDTYRSKLISISYQQSPDPKDQPVSPGEING
nr:Cordon-bleu protein-like [Ipomoea batatas]